MELSTPHLSLRHNCGLICLLQTVQGSKRLWPCVSVSLVPTEQSKLGYGVMTQSTGLSGWQGDFPLPTRVYSQLLTKGDFHLIAGSFLFFPGSERAAGISTHTPGVLQSSDNQRTEGDSTALPGTILKRWIKVETLWKSPTVQCLCREPPATSHSS